MKPNWIAWAITVGEGILLLGAAAMLSVYWLMLPVWMRTCAGACLGLGFLVVGFRFWKFRRKVRVERQPSLRDSEPVRELSRR